MARISQARLEEMQRVAAGNPEVRFPIIVTLGEGVQPEDIQDPGFAVDHRLSGILTGAASAGAIFRLSALADVLVEEDGEVRAIDESQL